LKSYWIKNIIFLNETFNLKKKTIGHGSQSVVFFCENAILFDDPNSFLQVLLLKALKSAVAFTNVKVAQIVTNFWCGLYFSVAIQRVPVDNARILLLPACRYRNAPNQDALTK
jgi:hypothetical protein